MNKIKNQGFSNLPIISTIVATWFSSEFFICYLQQGYIDGLPFLVAEIGNFLQFILIGYFFSNKVHNYKGLSLAKLIENNYGTLASKIILSCGLIYSIAFISMEFSILKSIIQEYFSINIFILISVLLVIVSSIGGLKSIIFSDLVCLIFFSMMMITLFLYAVNYTDFENLKLIINSDKRLSVEFLFNNYLGKTMGLFAVFLIPAFDPVIFQRLSICKDENQVRRCFFASGFCFFIIQIILSCLVLFLISKNQSIKSDIEPSELMFYLFGNYFDNSFLKFIIMSGFVSIILSTINSYINAGLISSSSHDNNSISAKLRGIIFGFISILIALKYQNLFQILMLGNSFYLPVATPAVLVLLIGIKYANKKVILIGMFLGICTTLFSHFIMDESFWVVGYIPILLGFCMNFGFIILASFPLFLYSLKKLLSNK